MNTKLMKKIEEILIHYHGEKGADGNIVVNLEYLFEQELSSQSNLQEKIEKFTLYSNPLGCPSCGLNKDKLKRFKKAILQPIRENK